MDARYDLFEFPPDAFPKWIGSAGDLPEARRKMEKLPPLAPGSEYLVRDFYSGTVVAYTLRKKHGTMVFPPEKDPRGSSEVLKFEMYFLPSGT
ncbi:MAG TPA: hypothetical protein VMT20_10900 [Terriglobia bacterium]|nr:hypothetical protein [Terriglobia bacterium]